MYTASVGYFALTYPSIPWKEYSNTFLADVVKIDENYTINISDVVPEVELLLKKTPARVLANYITWRVIQDSIDFTLDDKLINRINMQYFVTYGTVRGPPRLVLYSSL